MNRIICIVIFGLGCVACSFHVKQIHSESIKVESAQNTHPIDTILAAFRKELNEEMGERVAFSPLTLSKARPSIALHNWAADAVLAHETRNKRFSEPVIVFMNHGGLRSKISQGEVTLGNMFELMPFDNRVTWLRFPKNYSDSISAYINRTGGEPIAGCEIWNGKLRLAITDSEHFWVITNDYLANGGDYMTFMQGAIERMDGETLIRDIYIREARLQDTLIVDTVNRIHR